MTAPSLNRRRFVGVTALATGAVIAGCRSTRPLPQTKATPDLSSLPSGPTPAPVTLPHFPTLLHAFVWRNWELVPPERMAAVVGATSADIVRLGAAMGLGKLPRVTHDQQRRSYITVIKRNWHLLPYEQLLTLLDWTPEELAFTLREDDFLFYKLGSLKPQCEPLRFEVSNEAVRRREEEIARIVRTEFPNGAINPSTQLFSFVRELSAPLPQKAKVRASDQLRFCYSYFALYGDPLLETEADPYPDGYLARLSAVGVNGVWLQGVLHKLAPFPWDAGQSERHEERLANLRRLIAKAKRHGISLFLYLNEPRAWPISFFQARPELKGVVENDFAALCTSVPEVREFIAGAVEKICRAVPELGGFFTITASENLTNCWAHHHGEGCPRCGKRAPAEVVAEVNTTIADGIRRSGAKQRLIAWDWGWKDEWAPGIIERLPADVSLMSVSEWSLPIERGGVKSEVGEYSISSISPGPRAKRHWQLARARGLRVIAKIQAGNTWELSSVPYIPALSLVAEHAANLRAANVDGLMLGWTLGGYPSPNLEAVGEVLGGGDLAGVAQRRFGEMLAPVVLEAWSKCSEAFREFPFNGGVVYSAPLQNGPSNLLWAEPTGHRASMVGFPYDDLDAWRAIYPAEVFIAQLEKVANGFRRAARVLSRELEAGKGHVPAGQHQLAAQERDLMSGASIHWQSVANQSRFILARRALAKAANATEARPHLADSERLLRAELALVRDLHALQSRDSRIGFEATNHYYYVPMDLVEKVLNCRDLLDRWLPAQRAKFAEEALTK